MTRKNFESIAAGINHNYTLTRVNGDAETLKGMRSVVYSLAATFQQECPLFDTERFYIACGIAYRNAGRLETLD